MEAIKTWALSLCGAAMICGLLAYLLPEKSGGKTALSLFFLCVLAAPFSGGQQLSFDFPRLEEAELSAKLEESSNQLAYSIAEDHILRLTRETLSQNNFPAQNLRLDVDAGEELTMTLNLTLPQRFQERETELRTLLYSQCGIKNLDIEWQEEQ